MARRKPPVQPPKPPNPTLIQRRTDVAAKLQDRIEKGCALQATDIQSENELQRLRSKQTKWSDYNRELLARVFDVDVVAEEYGNVGGWGPIQMNPSPGQRITGFREGIGDQISMLESISERLELIPEADDPATAPASVARREPGKAVFIVHGHDNEAKESVARFVEKLGLKAIILHEKPNAGMTLIEKFEHNALDVGCALILLTPDDVGAACDDQNNLQPRARQNVILELGYFCGALGRNRVMVLYGEGVEVPSDFDGVVYEKLKGESWKLSLAKELKEAGLPVDMNDAL